MHKVIEFELLGLPKTTNSGGRDHWAAKAKEAQKWRRAVYVECRLQSRNIAMPFTKARITLTRCSASEPDFDGLVSSFKHVIDGLIDGGVIANDKSSVIGQPTYLWKRAQRGRGSIKVKVEEIYD